MNSVVYCCFWLLNVRVMSLLIIFTLISYIHSVQKCIKIGLLFFMKQVNNGKYITAVSGSLGHTCIKHLLPG